MANTKAKKSRRKAGNTPLPCGPGSTCGHSGCEDSCKVRYVGPTSHPRDHHVQEAAQGARHVWTAAIVAGLAVVLTGTVAYTSAQAQDSQDTPMSLMLQSLRRIEQRLDRMEPKLVIACVQNCDDAFEVCAQDAGDVTDAKAACEDIARSCRSACATPAETAE